MNTSQLLHFKLHDKSAAYLKRCSTTLEIVTEFVIEIGMERTRLFQCTPFHNTDHLMIFVTQVMIHFSDRAHACSEKFWLKSNRINHRTNTAISMYPVPLCWKTGKAQAIVKPHMPISITNSITISSIVEHPFILWNNKYMKYINTLYTNNIITNKLDNLFLIDGSMQSGTSYVVICTLEGATVYQLITQPHYGSKQHKITTQ